MTTYLLDARTASPHFPGIGRYVTNLAQALPDLLDDDERLVILATKSGIEPSTTASRIQENCSPFGLKQQWLIPRVIRETDAALYHSPYFVMPYFHRVPSVLTIYDFIPLTQPEWSSLRARLFFRFIFSLSVRRAAHIVTCSNTTLRQLHSRFPHCRAYSSATPLAPDPRLCRQSESDVSDLLNRLGLSEPYVLYFGSNRPHKNLVELVEAWRLIPHSGPVLLIAGAWDRCFAEAEKVAEPMIKEGRIRFLGYVEESDVAALYSGALCLVYPSLCEGFGLPVIEAMRCRTPVACSNLPVFREIARETVLRFDPRNRVEMAEKISQLLQDSQLRERFARRGLSRSMAFSWQDVAERTLEVYRRILVNRA